MFPSKKIRIASSILCVLALVMGLLSITWVIIYRNHDWHHYLFYNSYYIDGCKIACLIFIGSLLFWVAYRVINSKFKSRVCPKISYVIYGLYNAGALAFLIVLACNLWQIQHSFTDVRLDNQLASDNLEELCEAADSIVARSDYQTLCTEPYDIFNPNEFMMRAARKGCAPAQFHVGVFFHYHARYNEGHEQEELLNRAAYWLLKAAAQNYSIAQLNLGRMKTGELLSNWSYDFEGAKQYFLQAAENGCVSAYFYLGKLYRNIDLPEASYYWEMGAKKGDEDCMRMLEDPAFI